MEKSPYHIDIEPDGIYHLFTRGEGNELIFRTEENYHYFLRKLNEYTRDICSVLAFALMPNHFHLLIKTKSEKELTEGMVMKQKTSERKSSKVSETFEVSATEMSKFILQKFSNFLNSYTKSFNKMYDRKGGLFMNRIRRAKVKQDTDLSNFIFYIHKNAVHHGLTKNMGDWKFDSY